ncbi:MAG: T9SS type A sorting domain-containing protein [Ignavibacteriaceae bacterium]|nr:T9SS type A sorting domain-containing protein [Ignavibacteriaceae bacterium]
MQFNASSLASGIYLYRIESGNFVQTKKMILLK